LEIFKVAHPGTRELSISSYIFPLFPNLFSLSSFSLISLPFVPFSIFSFSLYSGNLFVYGTELVQIIEKVLNRSAQRAILVSPVLIPGRS
jgi:hypothetical protein